MGHLSELCLAWGGSEGQQEAAKSWRKPKQRSGMFPGLLGQQPAQCQGDGAAKSGECGQEEFWLLEPLWQVRRESSWQEGWAPSVPVQELSVESCSHSWQAGPSPACPGPRPPGPSGQLRGCARSGLCSEQVFLDLGPGDIWDLLILSCGARAGLCAW